MELTSSLNPAIPHHDIKIFVHDSFGHADQHSFGLIRGTREVKPSEIDDEFYMKGAVLPEFTNLTPLRMMTTDSLGEPWHECVGVFKLPPELMARVANTITPIKHFRKKTVINYLRNSDLGDSIRAYFIEQFALEDMTLLSAMGFSASKPGLKTVTVDTRWGAKPGMHFDSWDGITLNERAKSKIRFNVNLGPGDRTFIFSPITLLHAARQMPKKILADSNAEHLVRDTYLRAKTELVALRLRPGEAYFAPTDLLFHDGSTWGEEEQNFVYQMRADSTRAMVSGHGQFKACVLECDR